jgi:hypothetical protein
LNYLAQLKGIGRRKFVLFVPFPAVSNRNLQTIQALKAKSNPKQAYPKVQL